jgi:hypothetical protein
MKDHYMNFRVVRGFKPLFVLSAFSAVMFSAVAGPKIEFGEPTFDFGKLAAGPMINHVFTFTNTGDKVLEIKDVRPSCGCTTAGDYDHQVQPGKGGSIPVRFNSANYTGPIHKTVIIICNDPSETNLVLHIQGTIWRPIEVTPDSATFLLSSDTQTNEVKVVRIVSNLEQPLAVSEPECTNAAFQTTLKTVRAGKEFELAISLAPQSKPASLSAPITLKTSSTNLPLITVMARALVQAAVTAIPSTITLPATPLGPNIEFNVTIRNNSATPLVLSDPTVAAGVSPASEPGVPPGGSKSLGDTAKAMQVLGAEARIKEVQPGRMFILSATFPVGFRVQPSQSVELRVKTNHPQFPVIKVPVVQGHSLAANLSPEPSSSPAAPKPQ